MKSQNKLSISNEWISCDFSGKSLWEPDGLPPLKLDLVSNSYGLTWRPARLTWVLKQIGVIKQNLIQFIVFISAVKFTLHVLYIIHL